MGVGVILVLSSPAEAMRGGNLAVVVESEHLTPLPAAGGDAATCAMIGVVRNPNGLMVTVRLMWHATDVAGASLGLAFARVARIPPGQQRAFVSTPLAAAGQPPPSCPALAHVDRMEATAAAS